MPVKRKRVKGVAASSSVIRRNALDRVEAFFQKMGLRYKLSISVVLNVVLAVWAILSLVLILPQRSAERTIVPVISPVSVYAGAADGLDRAILAYFEIPKFKEITIRYGATITFPQSGALTPRILGDIPHLVLRVEGEIGERLYDLTKVPSLPFTIHMSNGDVKRLVTVEKVKTDGVQVRIFTAVK
ncbi:MAG: hypothetical protein ABFE01_12780 [Phycisphaerales bacterium]